MAYTPPDLTTPVVLTCGYTPPALSVDIVLGVTEARLVYGRVSASATARGNLRVQRLIESHASVGATLHGRLSTPWNIGHATATATATGRLINRYFAVAQAPEQPPTASA